MLIENGICWLLMINVSVHMHAGMSNFPGRTIDRKEGKKTTKRKWQRESRTGKEKRVHRSRAPMYTKFLTRWQWPSRLGLTRCSSATVDAYAIIRDVICARARTHTRTHERARARTHTHTHTAHKQKFNCVLSGIKALSHLNTQTLASAYVNRVSQWQA